MRHVKLFELEATRKGGAGFVWTTQTDDGGGWGGKHVFEIGLLCRKCVVGVVERVVRAGGGALATMCGAGGEGSGGRFA